MDQKLAAIRYGDVIVWPGGEGEVEGWRDVYTHDIWHRLVLVAPPMAQPGRTREVPLVWVTARHRAGQPTVVFE